MTLRTAILIMSACGVISDSILIAFYPQFFEIRYGLTNPIHVGSYIAAISIAVMCTLPIWAKVALKIETMHLLLYTQFIAGVLGIASAFAPSILLYWILTMLMFMCKASYLLMFPYLMRMEKHEDHTHIVGLLSVIIHIAGIFAATVGGYSLQSFGAATCVVLMATGDFCQMAICYYLIKSKKVIPTIHILSNDATQNTTIDSTNDTTTKPLISPPLRPKSRPKHILMSLAKLSIIMLIFDFSAYLIRPFFSVYWENITGLENRVLTGAVFAIPAIAALFGLWANRLSTRNQIPKLNNSVINLLLGAIGLGMQAIPEIESIILGRFIFGWGLFQIIVKLEVTLFKISSPEYYARDFSITNFSQNMGVLLSSFGAGYIVSLLGIQQTFILAAIGFVITALIDKFFFQINNQKDQKEALNNAL